MRMLIFGALGIAVYIGAIILEIMWLALCFGSVILGIVLLLFAPGILLLPLSFGFVTGTTLISLGVASPESNGGQPSPVPSNTRTASQLPSPTPAFEDDDIPF